MDIKPIETQYNGYRFRSRLEARWAVLFEHLHITYIYETEGFVLPSGTCYLPDFYLPDEDMYVEVKPNRTGASDELGKCVQFVNESARTLLLLGEIPSPKSNDEIPWWAYVLHYNSLERAVNASPVGIAPWGFIREWAVSKHPHNAHSEGSPDFYEKLPNWLNGCANNTLEWSCACSRPDIKKYIIDCNPYHFDEEDNQQVMSAFKAAKSARFEHGEKG